MLHLPFLDEAVKLVRNKKQVVGDDTDRLISYMTVMLCVFCAMIAAGKQLMGTAMTCWTPGHFTGDQNKYALDFCYIQNTYRVSLSENVAVNREQMQYPRVSYYQWIVLYFVYQAFMFHFPSFLWSKTSRINRIDLSFAINKTRELRHESATRRGEEMASVAGSLFENILTIRQKNTRPLAPCSLTFQYLLLKVLNLFVTLLTLTQVANYLHTNDFFWSLQGLGTIFMGSPWKDSPQFPRVTMCDVWIRDMGNVRTESFQCLLGMNYFSEKLFFVQWVWLMAVLLLVAINLVCFCRRVFFKRVRQSTLKGWLTETGVLPGIGDGELNVLVDSMGLDGFLTLYFIDSYNGALAAADFAAHFHWSKSKDLQLRAVDVNPEMEMMSDDENALPSSSSKSRPFPVAPPQSPMDPQFVSTEKKVPLM